MFGTLSKICCVSERRRGPRQHHGRSQLVALIFLLLIVGTTAENAPFNLFTPVCNALSSFFRTQTCIKRQDGLICKAIVRLLSLSFRGQDFCPQRPCTGYGQPNVYRCKGIFGCFQYRKDNDGLCDGLNVCCRTRR